MLLYIFCVLWALEIVFSSEGGIILTLNGKNYSNHSVITIDDIGKDNATALTCHTINIEGCCAGNSRGRWRYPSDVPVTGSMTTMEESFRRNRGIDIVYLYRRDTVQMPPPTGIYTCEIVMKISLVLQQHIFFGLYKVDEGIPLIKLLTFNSSNGTVNIISEGGPVSQVTWNRNGVQYQNHQQIRNKSSATYYNILSINSSNLSDYTGLFTCTVSNNRGSKTASTTLKAIEVFHEESYSEGSIADLHCYSDITVRNITWYAEQNKLVESTSNQQQLTLLISKVNLDLNNTEYTCVINILLLPREIEISVNKSFILKVIDRIEPSNTSNLLTVVLVIIFGCLFAITIIIAITILFIIIKKRTTKVTHDKSSVEGNEVSSFIEYSDDDEPEKLQDKVEVNAPCTSFNSPVKEKPPQNGFTETSFVDTRSKPINIEKFRQHVKSLHEDKHKGFELEFYSLEKGLKDVFEVSSKYRERNRFNNIQPYDFNRVVLKPSAGYEESCDYINASYINGYGKDNIYIAAQGPIENTEEDFWRMILDSKINTIIMLTRVFEGKKKCQQYYPDTIGETYKPYSESLIAVVMTSSTPYADFIIRELTVTKSGEDFHQLTMYHYMGWPDHGVPANAMSMISFIKMIRKRYPYSNYDLMLVHCSAGVGRTGSFITLDYMLERIKTEPTINIHEFVSGLRRQRMLMVQTADQYMFVHTALDELLTCGETEIPAANIRSVMRKLEKIDGSSSISEFQKQFNVLEDVTSNLATADYSEAQKKENKALNRYKNKLPFNQTRVYLRVATAEESNYINASFVGGYRRPGAYIVTQTPLFNTVTHFWRMVKDHQVKCIVMLCRLKENDKEVCCRYWPQGKGSPEEFGQFSITLTSQDIQTGYILRKMDVVETVKDQTSKSSVIHIQYLQWTEDSIPSTTSTVLEIADLVQKIQMSTGNKPVVVMCNDGVNRSGAFLCIHAQMERLKAEGVVDVFQFIKSVRCHRAGLVANKGQYRFCHEALADFLDGFETYANFKQPLLTEK